MTSTETEGKSTTVEPLCLSLTYQLLTASSLSSFLRTLQAALREVGRHLPRVGQTFRETGGPRLVLTRIQGHTTLECELLFAAPSDRSLLAEVSHHVFQSFMAALISMVRGSTQRTLFGNQVRHPLRKAGPFPPEVMSRIGQVERELGRFARATMSYGGYRVEIDSGMVTITEPSVKTG